MFDVLEYVERRDAILGEVRRVLKPGGYLLLTLPALRMLWSQFDEVSGHFLRYSRADIREEMDRNGFDIQRCGYFFAITVIPLLIFRVIPYRLRIRQVVTTETVLSASGGVLGKLLTLFERRFSMRTPIGSSLMFIARKR